MKVAESFGLKCESICTGIVDGDNPESVKVAKVAAGEGVVPWGEVKDRVAANGVDPLYIVHFEYNFDKTDLKKTIATEIAAFRKSLG